MPGPAHLTTDDSFRIARGLRVGMSIGCPLLGGGQLWLAWGVWHERFPKDPWQSGLMLALLGAIALFFAAVLVLVWRMRIDLREDGFGLRGLGRTRAIPWSKVEGYRLRNVQMNVYLADDELPLLLGHFERRELLYAVFAAHVPDLDAQAMQSEAAEIRADAELGFTDAERAARLGALRRLVRAVSWPGIAAAVLGAANAMFLRRADVQLAAACVLAAVPPLLVLLALGHRGRIRIGPAQGSAYPDALPGIVVSSIALLLIATLDKHTLLGDGIVAWMAPLVIGLAGLWLLAERDRLRAHLRRYTGALLLAGTLFLAAAWAGGGVYLINISADDSPPVWGETRVLKRSTSTTKGGKLYYVTVAPWAASPEPVELIVRRSVYLALDQGDRVALSVRRGALGIPWVDRVRPVGPG